MIQIYSCRKDIRVIVQGCFQDIRRTSLYLIDRDFKFKKHGYSTNSYIKVLDAIVAPAIKELNDLSYIFMQDNAFIYIVHSVRDQFTNAALICLDQPLYSPDLNPIKHAQAKLKELVDKEFPKIFKGQEKESIIQSNQRVHCKLVRI